MTGDNSKARIRVEVAYAKPCEQKILSIQVEEGTSLLEAVKQSGIQLFFPELDLDALKLGLFGKAVPKPAEQAARKGDRIEIYRALIADPKEVRKRRAAQAKQKKEVSA
ncbi:RnfH family protein [Endozoicomonas euniceicola]|uniref:UPF0125 protein NX720_14810 n=1 Tax=Endozoicomonas euniceicola TaxID=1234143 RepID=A0ABY6GNF3_9GAMM|nr:RnfH family protein [Endozoicomonas euniceicola]UYM14175.1 RnfH family protein [Endozoicomonas euniceicola]